MDSSEKSPLLYPSLSFAVNTNSEETPPNDQHQIYTLYKRRWYILVLFSLLSIQQSNVWITFGAVADTAREFYETSDANINLLATLGPVAYIPIATASSWAIGEYGLRKTTVTVTALVAIASVIRCFATRSSFWIVIVAQTLNAAAGTVVMTGPPAVSATWFGVNERTFATAVSSLANNFGASLGFLLGLFVHDNASLRYLLYGEAVFSVLLLLCFVIYFPSQPPRPPSATAAVVKPPKISLLISVASMLKETGSVLKNKDGILLVLAGGAAAGVYSGWGAMAVLILVPLGYTQVQAQWLGFVSCVVGIVGGIMLGWVHDHYRHFKRIIVLMFFLSTLAFGLFTLATEGYLSFTFIELMVVISCGGLFVNSVYPVEIEALVEVTYPIKEEVSSSLITLLNNFVCLIFLVSGDYIKAAWMNCVLTGTVIGSMLIMLFIKEEYKRSQIDLKQQINN